MTPEVDQKIGAYAPKGVDAAIWESVAELVRDRVRAVSPPLEMVVRLMAAASRLAAWAVQEHLPRDAAAIFSEPTIERYVSQLDASDKSKATVRSRLRRLAVDRTHSLVPKIGHRSVRPPYTPTELVGLWRLAGSQPTALRRRRLQALICCCAGAGCRSSDLRHVFNTSVVDHPEDPICLDIGGDNPRRVPVLAGFDRVLVEVAAATDGLLVGPSAGNKNLIPSLTGSIVGGEDLPRLEVARLRATWMVCLMSAWVPVATIMQLAGVKTMRVFEDLLPYCDLYSPAVEGDVARAVRDAWRPPWL